MGGPTQKYNIKIKPVIQRIGPKTPILIYATGKSFVRICPDTEEFPVTASVLESLKLWGGALVGRNVF